MNAIATQETEQLRARAGDALAASKSLVVDSQEMYEIGAEHTKAIKQLAKQVEDQRLSMTRPLDESKKVIMDFFRPITDALDKAESELKSKLVAYSNDQARIRREAEERARREAEAARRAEQERLAAEAAAAAEAGDEAKADELVAEAVAAEAAPVIVVAPHVEAPKAAGVSKRDNWIGEVTDIGALIVAAAERPELRVLLAVDTKALGKLAKAYKDTVPIPGVRIYNEPVLSVRA
jgi:hypothetical protein